MRTVFLSDALELFHQVPTERRLSRVFLTYAPVLFSFSTKSFFKYYGSFNPLVGVVCSLPPSLSLSLHHRVWRRKRGFSAPPSNVRLTWAFIFCENLATPVGVCVCCGCGCLLYVCRRRTDEGLDRREEREQSHVPGHVGPDGGGGSAGRHGVRDETPPRLRPRSWSYLPL